MREQKQRGYKASTSCFKPSLPPAMTLCVPSLLRSIVLLRRVVMGVRTGSTTGGAFSWSLLFVNEGGADGSARTDARSA